MRTVLCHQTHQRCASSVGVSTRYQYNAQGNLQWLCHDSIASTCSGPSTANATTCLQLALDLREKLRQSAMNALYDPNLKAMFGNWFKELCYENLTQELGNYAEGAAAQLIQRVSKTMEPRAPFEYGACFAAGTMIWTDKGPVPIEQIQVGDFVLSKPESGEGVAHTRQLKPNHLKSI